ncbi:MAG: hypothetical protein ACRDZN_12855, partial [Acidimicrobiales bacterium]
MGNVHRGKVGPLVAGCAAFAVLLAGALPACSDDTPDGAPDAGPDAGNADEPEAVAPEVRSPADATTVVATD